MKGTPAKAKGAPDGTVPNVRTLKSAQCKSLSGRSTLGYEVGATPDGEIHVRVTRNSGSGCFGREWTPLRELQRELARAPGPVTSGMLRRAFAGRSANTSGFVAAALLGEGLLEPLANARGYAPTDGVGFMKEMRQLLERGPAQTVASAVARKAAAAKEQAQKSAAKPQKADAAMPAERKAKAPPRAKARRK
jgi:hypothetical protein